jgi:hypothetical protein
VHETISIEEWVQRYLRRLIQRNKPRGEPAQVPSDPDPVEPFMPASAFVLGDEVIPCEVDA